MLAQDRLFEARDGLAGISNKKARSASLAGLSLFHSQAGMDYSAALCSSMRFARSKLTMP